MRFFAFALFPTYCPEVTDEQFNLFHGIERELYSRLIFNLGREPEESMLVMGFLMWLELGISTKMDLVAQLLNLPYAIVNEVANESVVCLKCVETDIIPFKDGIFDIVQLPKLVRKNVRLQFFHEHRSIVINGVIKMVNDVCVRAFKDILRKFDKGKFIASTDQGSDGTVGSHIVATPSMAREVGWSNDYAKIFATAIANKTGNCSTSNETGCFSRGQILASCSGEKVGIIGQGKRYTAPAGCEDGSLDEEGRIFTALNQNNIGNVGYVGGIIATGISNEAGYLNNGEGQIFSASNGNYKVGHNIDHEGSSSNGNEIGNIGENGMCLAGLMKGNELDGRLNVGIPSEEAGYFIPFPYSTVGNATLVGSPIGGFTDQINIQQNLAAHHESAKVYGRSSTGDDFLSSEQSAMFSRLNMYKHINDILPDDRTIFLTFSKGYPVSENELRDFFNGTFGDFIEAIYLQEVRPDEQVLFARLVCRSASMVDEIVAGGIAKFNINGKHAWARKYVKKNKAAASINIS